MRTRLHVKSTFCIYYAEFAIGEAENKLLGNSRQYLWATKCSANFGCCRVKQNFQSGLKKIISKEFVCATKDGKITEI